MKTRVELSATVSETHITNETIVYRVNLLSFSFTVHYYSKLDNFGAKNHVKHQIPTHQ